MRPNVAHVLIVLVLTATLTLPFSQSKKSAVHKAVIASDTTVVSDSFTAANGTALENHQLDTGQTWQHAPFSPNGILTIDNGWAHHGSVGFRTIYLANAQLNADSFVSAHIKFKDTASPYILLRAKSSTETYLAVYYDFESQAWVMISNVNYTGPQSVYVLGTWPETITAGDTRDIKFQASSDELRFYTQSGGQWIERIFAEDYSVAEGGMAGIGLYGSSGPAGTYMDDFVAGNLGTQPSPSPSPSVSPSPSPIISPSPSPSPVCTTWHLTTDTPTKKVWDCF